MTCKNCGLIMDENANVCPNCGTVVNNQEVSVTPLEQGQNNGGSVQVEQPAVETPVQPVAPAPAPEAEPQDAPQAPLESTVAIPIVTDNDLGNTVNNVSEPVMPTPIPTPAVNQTVVNPVETPQNPTNISTAPIASEPVSNNNDKKKKSSHAAAILIVLLLICVALLAYVLFFSGKFDFSKNNKETPTTTTSTTTTTTTTTQVAPVVDATVLSINGVKVTKLNDYNNEIKENGLYISNENTRFVVDFYPSDALQDVLYDSIKNSLVTAGAAIESDMKLDNGGRTYYIYKVVYENVRYLYAVTNINGGGIITYTSKTPESEDAENNLLSLFNILSESVKLETDFNANATVSDSILNPNLKRLV